MNAEERAKLLKVLQGRFEKNMQRHKGATRNAVASRLKGTPAPRSRSRRWRRPVESRTSWGTTARRGA